MHVSVTPNQFEARFKGLSERVMTTLLLALVACVAIAHAYPH